MRLPLCQRVLRLRMRWLRLFFSLRLQLHPPWEKSGQHIKSIYERRAYPDARAALKICEVVLGLLVRHQPLLPNSDSAEHLEWRFQHLKIVFGHLQYPKTPDPFGLYDPLVADNHLSIHDKADVDLPKCDLDHWVFIERARELLRARRSQRVH